MKQAIECNDFLVHSEDDDSENTGTNKMNETEWIFTSIAAFGVGYGLAHFAKRLSDMVVRWGWLIAFCVVPMIAIILLFVAASITNLNSIAISLAMAMGFVIRILRR